MKNLRFPLVILIVLTAMFPPPGRANPKGGQVKSGAATFESGPNSLTIRQTTDRGIIQWQDFSIGAGESTTFIQPSASSATLNRVVGGIPSNIQGSLQANGKIYLINPNGILVGPTGRINTAEFVASTLDVPDAEFLAGSTMHFKGTSLAGVVNLGTITATNGDVVLMGHTVQNAGTISAANGVAVLAAGNDILLQPAGDERVVVNAGIATGGAGVVNFGTIRAAQAELKAAGGNVYALAVNNTGIVRATGITSRNGRVILSANGGVVQNTGTLSAKNLNGSGGLVRMASGRGGHTIQNGTIDASGTAAHQNGGTVELLGDTVTVGAQSLIDVSGVNAGTVAIGVDAATASKATAQNGIGKVLGDNSQTDPTQLTTSQKTEIQAGSHILANATGAGQGGHVVVWSEQQSIVGGTIEAKGGALGGDGGLVETSGRLGLTITPGTVVNTAAPKGKAGNWLLDPAGITVDNNTTDTSGGNPPFTQNASTNNVKASDIVTALGSGDVTIQTLGGPPPPSTPNFSPNTDIVVNSAISIPTALGGAHTLSLISAGGITLNAAVGGAASDVSLFMQAHGAITVSTGATVQMNGISAVASTGNISVSDQITALNNNNISLIAPNAAIHFIGSGQAIASPTGTVFLATTSPTSATTTGTITTSGAIAAVSAGSLDIWSGPQGVATSGSPFLTSVDHLVATVNAVGQTSGGGVFIKNSSSSDLHIGGVIALPGQPAAGILIPNFAGFGGVEINNVASAILLDSATGERIAVPGDIKLTTGSSKDIVITNTAVNSVRSHFGSVTLNAAGNVAIGDATHPGVNVRGQTDVTVQAGGNVTVAGSLLKAVGGTGVSVTAGGDINILTVTVDPQHIYPAIIGTSGGAPISLTTGAGKTFNDNTTSSGGVLTTLTTAADETPPNVTTFGANITINADLMTINSPINARNGIVTLDPVGVHRAIDLGTKTAGELGITAAEINNITAAHARIGSLASDGDLTVSAAIAPAHISGLDLTSGGNVLPNQSITLQKGSTLRLQATGHIGNQGTGSGNINAANLVAITTNGFIALGENGNVNVPVINFTSGGDVFIGSLTSPISIIANSTSTGAFQVASSVNLAISGANQGGAGAFINTLGNLTFASGASLAVSGGEADFVLPNGNVINNSGSPGPVTNTGRIIVWEKGPPAAHNPLGISDYLSAPETYANDPVGAGNIFYYQINTPPAPPPPPQPPSTNASSSGQTPVAQLTVAQLTDLHQQVLALLAAGDFEVSQLPYVQQITARWTQLQIERENEQAQEAEAARQQRLAQWPPDGLVEMSKQEIREAWDQDSEANGRPDHDPDLYWKLLNLPPDQQVPTVLQMESKERRGYIDQNDNGNPVYDKITGNPIGFLHNTYTPAQDSTLGLIIAENSLAFTSEAAAKQFCEDRGIPYDPETIGNVNVYNGPAGAVVKVGTSQETSNTRVFIYVGNLPQSVIHPQPPPAPVTVPIAVNHPATSNVSTVSPSQNNPVIKPPPPEPK